MVGCLYELHVYGGHPSFRTFIGGLPMLASINLFAQLSRVARLNRRLNDAAIFADAASTGVAFTHGER